MTTTYTSTHSIKHIYHTERNNYHNNRNDRSACREVKAFGKCYKESATFSFAEREETLKNLANRIAEKAVKYGKKFSLEPMNPFERKVIHSALSENEDVKTESEGVEPNRYVVVIPNNLKANSERTERYGKRDNKRKDDRKERKEKPEVIKLEKKTMGFGTFLGNSLKED